MIDEHTVQMVVERIVAATNTKPSRVIVFGSYGRKQRGQGFGSRHPGDQAGSQRQ